MNLQPGDTVQAARHLDPEGANVPAGYWGVVFGEYNFYGDDCGPIVHWFDSIGKPWGVCNVYDGDVK